MRYTIIDEHEAPRSPNFHLNKTQQEADALVAALTPGTIARIEEMAGTKLAGLRMRIYDAAARLGRPVEVWDDDGVVYAGLGEQAADERRP